MGQGLAIRTVALRDGLLMSGDHNASNGRHWKATASAFGILDYSLTPMVWIERPGPYTQVVGEMAATLPKPGAAMMPANFTPLANETLLRWEVILYSGAAILRTWWAQGENLHRTRQVARLEPLTKDSPARFAQLLALMNWRG